MPLCGREGCPPGIKLHSGHVTGFCMGFLECVRTFFLAFSQLDDIFILYLCLTVAKLADPGTHVWSTPWTDHTAISASQEVVNAHKD